MLNSCSWLSHVFVYGSHISEELTVRQSLMNESHTSVSHGRLILMLLLNKIECKAELPFSWSSHISSITFHSDSYSIILQWVFPMPTWRCISQTFCSRNDWRVEFDAVTNSVEGQCCALCAGAEVFVKKLLVTWTDKVLYLHVVLTFQGATPPSALISLREVSSWHVCENVSWALTCFSAKLFEKQPVW